MREERENLSQEKEAFVERRGARGCGECIEHFGDACVLTLECAEIMRETCETDGIKSAK